MLFDQDPERSAIADSAARFVAEHYPAESRLARLKRSAAFDPARWRDIADLGWLATDLPERCGGLALDFAMLGTLAESLAPGLPGEPFLTQTAMAGYLLGHAGNDTSKSIEHLLAGEEIVVLAHHETRQAAYYRTPIASEFSVTKDGFRINADKCAVPDGAIADTLLVSARDSNAPHDMALFRVPVTGAGAELTPWRTFDGRTIADIRLRDVTVANTAKLDLDTGERIDEALARYTVLVAADTLGLMRAVLDLTVAYVNEREQFGQKLAGFQALQHRLADMQLGITRAESLVEAAYVLIDAAGYADARAAIAAARVGTEDNGVRIAEEGIQLHGGIGMTNEYILAHYAKRITANRFLTGTRDEHVLHVVAPDGG